MSTKPEILRALEDMGKRYPQMRFGQMVANIPSWALGPNAQAVWDVDDEKFLNAIRDPLVDRGVTQP